MDRKRKVEFPDSGWSWVVAFAACFCSFVLPEIFRTSSVLFVTFTDSFGVTQKEAFWPLVVCVFVVNLTGPVAGILAQGYGVRPVVMAGAIIGAVGMSSCFFTSNPSVIIGLFGVVFGVGYGFVNTLFPVIVNTYFLNLRSTAIGIAYSGSCFGTIIFPAFIEYLMEIYGLSGCFLLIGAVVLNLAVAAALMRPAHCSGQQVQEENIPLTKDNSDDCKFRPLIPQTRKQSISLNFIDTNCSDKSEYEYEGDLDPKSNPQRELQAELARTLSRRTAFHSNDTRSLGKFQEESYDSVDTSISSFTARRGERALYKEHDDLLRAQREFEDSLSDFQNVIVDIEITSKSDELLNRIDPSEVKTSQLTDSCPARHSFSISSAERPPRKFKSPLPSSGPLKKRSFRDSSGELTTFDLYPVKENSRRENRKLSESHSLQTSKIDGVPEDTNRVSHEDTLPSNRRKNLPGIVECFTIVVTSPVFYLTALTNVVFYFLYYVFVSIIVDYSLDRNIPYKGAKYILFSFVICDMFGRLCLGWITDRKYLTRPRFVMLGMGGIGLVFFAFPFASDYWSLLVVSGCYGALLGCTLVMFPILLVDYLGIEVYAVAFGCNCFLKGIASFFLAFLIGVLRDSLGSYENIFFLLGVISLVASAAWILEKCFLSKSSPLLEETRNTSAEQ